MNLVGKIFVGIIALMSVVCLTISVMSYASHHNWKEKSAQLTKQLDDAKKEQQSLNAQKDELNRKIKEEEDVYTQAIAALQTKTDALVVENQTLKDDNTKLNAELSKRVDVISANNSHIADLRQQIDVASHDLATAQQLRANYLQDLARTMGKLHELSAVYGDLKDKNEDLVKSRDDALAVLNQNGLSADPKDYADLPKFGVKGSIETVKEGNDGLLMISLGSDDGLSENNKLDVKRGDSYLGKIEVVTLEPNRSVCKVLPEYRQGAMQVGDEVYSQKFN